MKQLFIHNALFRIICPPIYGTIVYLLVLLAFDSIGQLTENFFSQEALLCIGLTFILSESLRLMILLLDKYYPIEKSIKGRIVLQTGANLICTLIVISGGLAVYFIYLVGYTSFTTELLTFNSIYLITSLFYTMLYLSVFYLNQHNKAKLQKEKALRKKMEHQFQKLTKEVNPELLYNSLETLIILAHQDAALAEKYIDKLSSVYRYFLDHTYKELIPISEEIKAVQHLVYLYNARYDGNIHFHPTFSEEEMSLLMVPGTLLELMEDAILRTMIDCNHPLEVDAYTESTFFVLNYQRRDRLMPRQFHYTSIEDIRQVYSFFTDKAILYHTTEEECVIKIPLLEVQKEHAHPISSSTLSIV